MTADDRHIELTSIGVVRTAANDGDIPRHWSVSDVEGVIEIFEPYRRGLQDIESGQRIIVLFYFDRSPAFDPSFLTQTPPHKKSPLGVFSICSPRRPNPIGLSVLKVVERRGASIRVKGIDMYDGTPVVDIKPFITGEHDCPSRNCR